MSKREREGGGRGAEEVEGEGEAEDGGFMWCKENGDGEGVREGGEDLHTSGVKDTG